MCTYPGSATRRIVVLAGPSAVGKTSIVHCVKQQIPNLYFSVSVTTRQPRPGEVDGVDYCFITDEQFHDLVDHDALLEWAEIHGGLQRSGTPKTPIMEALARHQPVLIEVDLAGARAIKQKIPDVITVFLAPPNWDVLQQRLIGRGTEAPEVIQRRLDTAREELAAQNEFDRIIVNHQLENACQELVTLLTTTDSATL